jgi:hypothetical protein
VVILITGFMVGTVILPINSYNLTEIKYNTEPPPVNVTVDTPVVNVVGTQCSIYSLSAIRKNRRCLYLREAEGREQV